MNRYAALIGLWIWSAIGRDAAPFPNVDQAFAHQHDFTAGPLVAALGDGHFPRTCCLTCLPSKDRGKSSERSMGLASRVLGSTNASCSGGERNNLLVTDQFHPRNYSLDIAHWHRNGAIGTPLVCGTLSLKNGCFE